MLYLRLLFVTLRLAISWLQGGKRLALPDTDGSPLPHYLIASLYAWKGIRHRPHHLAAGLGRRGHRVVYFRPVYLKEAVTKGWEIPLKPRLTQVEENVWHLEAAFFPGENVLPQVKDLNEKLMRGLLEEVIGDGKDWALVVNDPKKADLAKAFPFRSKVYDILDNYEAFSWATSEYPRYEQEMLAEVDLVVAGTNVIYEAKRQQHGNVVFMACGADVEHFGRALDENVQVAPAIADLPKPVLFYMGAVDERIDQDLILELAQDFPEGTVALAGPLIGDFSKLRGLPEVKFLGLVPYEQLPEHLAGVDVCMIPFVLNDITRNINPTKLLEYMAAGKPVVSAPIPDVVHFYEGRVLIADGHEEFVAQVREALSDAGQRLAADGLAFSKDKTWERFTAEYIDHIQKGMNA